MSDILNVCGIAGSLRTGSFNRSLLRAAAELAPAGMEVEIFDLAGVPLYNQDIEDAGDPAAVEALKDAIRRADGLLIVTPEYNGSVPGVLKNALDWASRKGDADSAALSGKPAAIMGATPGLLGTARAQGHLREILAGAGALTMANPKVHLMKAGDRVDDGRLVDDTSRQFVAGLMERFRDWIARLDG